MVFNPGIEIGAELTHDQMRTIFKCGNMGGMRRSKQTGTLVIISDDTKGLYRDVWKNGVLHYTGMGKSGDQVLEGNQNGTLYYSDTNGVEVHLFEVLKRAVYTYRGVVKLADKPYKDRQPDEAGNMRDVWMFPIVPLSEEAQSVQRELSEQEISKLSNNELARYTAVKNIKKDPKKTETVVYYRDPYLKQMVKRIADGKCQYCGSDAPFVDKQGNPYLEAHHVIRLADGGQDTIDNVVAICPNCHRKMHVLNDERDVVMLEGIATQNKRCLERLLGTVTVFEESYNKVVGNKKVVKVVAAVICDGDKIFATQRGYGDFKGGWEFPGGKIEEGETPQEALIREIKEELEVEIKVGNLIDTIEYDYPNFHLSMDCFWAKIASGDLVLKEHEAAKWLTKETLDSVEWLPADIGLVNYIKTELE